jgi:hypothetical protein
MKNFIRLFVIILITGAASSCTEKLEPKPLTYSQLLTGKEKKTWTLSSLTIVDQKDPFDLAGNQVLDPCQLDDQFIFYANEEKKMEYANGPSKCSNNEPEILITDVWAVDKCKCYLGNGHTSYFWRI